MSVIKKTINPGTYTIHNEKAYQLQYDIMHGKYGDYPWREMFTHKRVYEAAMDFSNMEDVVIDAYGATLLLDGIMIGLLFENCKNITLRGLTIDMKRRPFSKGKIVHISDSSFVVAFDDDIWISEKMPAPRMTITDPNTGLIVKSIDIEGGMFELSKSKVAEKTIQYPYQISKELMGYPITVHHSCNFCSSVLIHDASNICLEDVTIHCQPGMGIVGHRSENISLNRVKIVPSEGNHVSTNTDATHFASCRGKLEYIDCEFSGNQDDSGNIHTYYQTVLSDLGNNTYECKVMVSSDTHSMKLDYPEVGDTMEYCHKRSLKPLETYKVIDVVPDQESYSCKITLDKPLPADAIGNYLTSISQLPELIVRGCRFYNHRAFGLRIRTRNVLVENCEFSHCTLAAINISAEGYWNESGCSENVTIRGNKTEKCGIWVDTDATEIHEPLYKNISIEDNHIDGDVKLAYIDSVNLNNNNITGDLTAEYCSHVNHS